MKTIETIKQEFKNSTGKELPIYTFDGKLGVLMECRHTNCWATDFIPMDDFLKMDNIDFDCVRWVEVDADPCEEGEEITDAPFVNPENEQNLRVDCAWSPVIYNKSDEYTRQLLVTTNKYYDWTSERRRMIDNLYDDMKKYSNEFDGYDGTETEEEDIKDRDKWISHLKERLESRKKDWEETCSHYEDPVGWEDFSTNKADFSSVLQETLDSYEFCTLVHKTITEFIENN